MKVIAYIDAFNFYFGLTYNTKYKWCDLYKLCEKLLPGHEIIEVKVFTGKSKVLEDPDQPSRQNTYLRALEITNKKIKIITSSFVVDKKHLPRADGEGRIWVKVAKEKGSDVKLATYLLVDAFQNNYEMGAILSNDSDLELPIKMVRNVFHKKIIVLAPIQNPNRRLSDKLMKAAGGNNHKLIPIELVSQCQLPNIIQRKGKKDLIKPRGW